MNKCVLWGVASVCTLCTLSETLLISPWTLMIPKLPHLLSGLFSAAHRTSPVVASTVPSPSGFFVLVTVSHSCPHCFSLESNTWQGLSSLLQALLSCPACHSPFFPLTSLTHPVEGLPAYCLDLGLLLCSKWTNCSLSPVVFRDNLPVGDRSFRIFIKSQTTANTWGLTDILSCMVLVLLLHLFGCFSVSCGPKQNEQLTSWRFTF